MERHQNINDDDIFVMLNRMREQNSELYNLFFSRIGDEDNVSDVILNSSYLPFKASVLVYGLVEQACLESGYNQGIEGFTTRGVPIVSQNTIDSLLDGKSSIKTPIKYHIRMCEKNPVIGGIVNNFTLPRLEMNRKDDSRVGLDLQFVNISTGLMYMLLDTQNSANAVMSQLYEK